MPIDLVTVLAVGVVAIIITILIGFILLRIDNSRTVRENIRLQTAIARNSPGSGSYQGASQNGAGDLGWLGSIISEIIAKNPELVEKFISNFGKKEG